MVSLARLGRWCDTFTLTRFSSRLPRPSPLDPPGGLGTYAPFFLSRSLSSPSPGWYPHPDSRPRLACTFTPPPPGACPVYVFVAYPPLRPPSLTSRRGGFFFLGGAPPPPVLTRRPWPSPCGDGPGSGLRDLRPGSHPFLFFGRSRRPRELSLTRTVVTCDFTTGPTNSWLTLSDTWWSVWSTVGLERSVGTANPTAVRLSPRCSPLGQTSLLSKFRPTGNFPLTGRERHFADFPVS